MTGLLFVLGTVALAVAALAWFPAAAGFWLFLERRRGRLRLRELDVGDVRMPYLEGGQGAPLVLVHGFGGDKDNFTRIARFLTPHFRVLIPDLPGFGDASRDVGSAYDIASQVRHVRAFTDALGLERTHLGGNSMGGFIAAQYAATYPGEVRSLWLLDAAGFEGAFDTAAIRRFNECGETVLLVRSIDGFEALMATATHRPPWLPRALRHALALRGIRDRPLHERIFREVGAESPPLDAISSRITAPTLIVWGRDDRILNPLVAPRMHALITGSELVMLDDTGHLPMIEQPRRVAADWVRFVARRGS